MSDAFDQAVDQALDAIERIEVHQGCVAVAKEAPDDSASGTPVPIPPPSRMDEQLGDAAHTLRLIARRIEACRRAAACC